MKSKQLVAMAALALLVALPARAAEVVSSNIVGYERLSVSSGLSIVGNQFNAVGGSTNGIENLVAIEGLSPWGEDSVRFWNGSDYEDLYYYAYDADEGSEGLLDTGKDGWGDLDQNSVEKSMPAGTAFWLSVSSSAKVCMSGEVPTNSTLNVDSGLTLVCNPLPMRLDIQDVKATGLSPWGEDSIRIWDGSEYKDYYYYAYDADEGSEGLLDTEKDGWGDLDQMSVTVPIEIGQGFWIQSSSGATLTFPALSAE